MDRVKVLVFPQGEKKGGGENAPFTLGGGGEERALISDEGCQLSLLNSGGGGGKRGQSERGERKGG